MISHWFSRPLKPGRGIVDTEMGLIIETQLPSATTLPIWTVNATGLGDYRRLIARREVVDTDPHRPVHRVPEDLGCWRVIHKILKNSRLITAVMTSGNASMGPR